MAESGEIGDVAKPSQHTGPVPATAEHLADVLKEMMVEIVKGNKSDGNPNHSFPARMRYVLRERGPSLRKAARSFVDETLLWLRQGGPWRAFLFTTVGTVIFLALSGLVTFLLFFLIATGNAVAVGLLMSLTGVGAFMAFFFTALTVIYVGALFVASIMISTGVFLCACAVLFVAGWIAFSWVVWTGLRKGVNVFRGSTSYRTLTSSAISTS